MGDSVTHVTDTDAIDFAIAAWREDGAWRAERLPPRLAESLASLVAALGARASESGVVGLVSIGDDTFLIVRVDGGRARCCCPTRPRPWIGTLPTRCSTRSG